MVLNTETKTRVLTLQSRELNHPEINSILIFPDREATALAAAERIDHLLDENPAARVTWATGTTMLPVYRRLHPHPKTTAFHLDEYWPCLPTASHSFVRYLSENLFTAIQLPPENIHMIDGNVSNGQEEAIRYEELLKENPIDLAVLGIGPGCHIGFNERGTPFSMGVHLAQLSQETVNRDRQRGQLPQEHAITQGPKNISEVKTIILIGYDEKGSFLAEALYGPIGPESPASVLRLPGIGNKVTVMIDEKAAKLIDQEKVNYS